MRAVLGLILVWLLTSCGGSGPSTPLPITIGQYGDSVSWGMCATCTSGRIDSPPVQTLNQQSKGAFLVVDYSIPGATVREALQYTPSISTAPEQFVLLRFGGADALLGTPADQFEGDLQTLISAVVSAHHIPVLTGIIWTPTPNPVVDQFDKIIRQLAINNNLAFIGLRSLPYDPVIDTSDGLHPSQDYSSRLSTLIAATLLNLTTQYGR